MASVARIESNRWLREHAAACEGHVLSIGSRDDLDGEGHRYREYFTRATSYTTSEHVPYPGCDLVIDVRRMPEIADGRYDTVFCSGVLEHVDDYEAGMREITRITRAGGALLLGLPFRQAIHLAPTDYWRFTAFGIRVLLDRHGWDVADLAPIDQSVPDFPATYWARAVKRSA
ncbi:MAG: methyltransferase domain-containing protein [Vicinamibacterales bacterium]